MKKPTVPYLIQQWLKANAHRHVDGKVMLRVIASDLGLQRYNASSRLTSMVKLGYVVDHGRGVISMGPNEAPINRIYKPLPGNALPRREKVASTSFDQRYILRQLEHGPVSVADMSEIFGDDENDVVQFRRAYRVLYGNHWATRTARCEEPDVYELTELGKKVVVMLDSVEADEEKERQGGEGSPKKEPEPAKLQRVRRPSTRRAGQSAAARMAEPLCG